MSDQWDIAFKVPGRPVSKSYDRDGKGGMWLSKRSKAYQTLVSDIAVWHRPNDWPMDAEYRLRIRAIYPDGRTADADNINKAIQDALEGVLWDDDKYVLSPDPTVEVDRNRDDEGCALVGVKLLTDEE